MLSKFFCFRRSGSRKQVEEHTPAIAPPASKSQTSSITNSPKSEKGISFPEPADTRPTPSQKRALILDLGDVLFHYSARNLTALSPSTFHAVILTPAWNEYECGRLTEDEVIEAVGKELSLEPDTIREALSQCRQTLHVDHELYDQLKALKAEMNGNLKVYAMTNISGVDFGRLKAILPSWDLFDAEFTSFEAGMIKPELGYYRHVLDKVDLNEPSSAIFVDDKVANVNAARSFGIRGIVFKSAAELMRQLRNQLYDPVSRARKYMRDNARNHVSQIEGGPEFRDVFSQFLIHKELRDTSIISLSPADAFATEIEKEIEKARLEAKTWNYFIGSPVGTTKEFPEDVDDTAMALLAFSPPAHSANLVLDRFLANRHSRDGLVQTYFDEKRPRVSIVELVNVVRVFYHYNRGSDIQNEFRHVQNVLLNRAYIDGSAMYISAEPFLFFFSRLLIENPEAAVLQSLRGPLASALRMRVGRRGDAFAVAVRILACQSLDVWAESDIEYLKELQESDGGWEVGWVCRYGRTQKRIGSRGVITAYAIKALEQNAKRL
ncbi:HAD-like protein [Setomelanomma holmii]|uniref:HAD-like protein n=1 Tax=Setomelanomma holmii TaxID=210430 RepID=A0A9P4LML4_9PLEO|nr:HAD-like protein [Setomelanomma holmii]